MNLDGTKWIGKKGTKAEGITLDLDEKMPFIYHAVVVDNRNSKVYDFFVRGINVDALVYKFDQVCAKTGRFL